MERISNLISDVNIVFLPDESLENGNDDYYEEVNDNIELQES
jgi:hypothetical protein